MTGRGRASYLFAFPLFEWVYGVGEQADDGRKDVEYDASGTASPHHPSFIQEPNLLGAPMRYLNLTCIRCQELLLRCIREWEANEIQLKNNDVNEPLRNKISRWVHILFSVIN